MMNSHICSIGTAVPENKISQLKVADFMALAHGMNEEESRKLRALYRATGIHSRYSVLEDFNGAGQRLFQLNRNRRDSPTTSRRMDVFKEEAVHLAKKAILNCLHNVPDFASQEITHILTVSCTGLYAPGLDIDLVEELGLSTRIRRTGINYMGCYAALTAIKMADSICRAETNAWVLISCVELCSIHFQNDKTQDNILAQAIFGDGAAAILMHSRQVQKPSLKVVNSYCDLVSEGKSDMAWGIGNFGFEMKLTSYVPEILRNGIKCLIRNLMESMDLELHEIDYYAIHPGGKKILQVVEEELNLSKDGNAHSRRVLNQYGNMSSPTILFVLSSIWNQLADSDDGKRILSVAFGPGLTLESILFQVQIK